MDHILLVYHNVSIDLLKKEKEKKKKKEKKRKNLDVVVYTVCMRG